MTDIWCLDGAMNRCVNEFENVANIRSVSPIPRSHFARTSETEVCDKKGFSGKLLLQLSRKPAKEASVFRQLNMPPTNTAKNLAFKSYLRYAR